MMTRPHPLRTTLTVFFGAVALYLALALLAIVRAHAGPADALHDPLTAAPLDTWADLARAKSAGGWALALVAGLVMLARAATRFPGALGAWLGTGRRATLIGGALAIGVAVYDVLAAGGSLAAVVIAGIGAALAALHPAAPAPGPRGVSDPTTTAAILGVLALTLAMPSCATVGRAAKAAVVDCARADAVPVLELAGRMLAQAAIDALRVGEVDWGAAEAAAIAQGAATGGCAARRFVAELAKAPKPQGLLATADPGAALLGRLEARWGVTYAGAVQ